MKYRIIDGKIYQEADKTVEQLQEAVQRVQDKAQASITGIATCTDEIRKLQNQIDGYVNNIRNLAQAEGLDKSIIALVRDTNSVSFYQFLA